MPPFASSIGSGNLISSTSTVSYRKGGSIQNKVSSKTKFPKRQSTLQKSFVTCQYLVFSLVCVLIGAVYFLTRAPLHLYYDRLQVNDDRSIYVQGGGFSGFWYTFGNLNTITNPEEHNYYCYSSGCLCVALFLLNRQMQNTRSVAFDIQEKWNIGILQRKDIVEHFIDTLILPGSNETFDYSLLDRINIIRTTYGKGATIKKAKSPEQLKDLLIQTTWIPLVTGDDLWVQDLDGELHMDGFYSKRLHPKCSYSLRVPLDFDIIAGTLNPNIGPDDVLRYWEAGQANPINITYF